MLALKHQFVLVLMAIVLFFTNLGKPKLWDRDEPRNARCAVEMMERHDWTVPTFNGELRTHKPVLLYWLMMSAYSLFGVNEFAARFWSAALAIGTVLLTYSMGRRLFNARAAFWAAGILSTTLMFNVAARAATPDSTLIFFMTLALAIYVQTAFPSSVTEGSNDVSQERQRAFYPRRLLTVPIYAAMGMAVLAKGPIGIVLPTAIIGLFLAIIRLSDHESTRDSASLLPQFLRAIVRVLSPLHLLRTAWSMRPVTALVSAMAIALPWYLLVGIATDGEWVRSFLLEHNVSRASSAMEGHAGSTLFYYPIAMLIGFFPWSILAVPLGLDIWGVLTEKARWATGYTFLLCWVGVFVAVFSIAQTKLPSYVTPAYPAVALLAGAFLERQTSRESRLSRFWLQASGASLTIVGAIGVIAIGYASKIYLPGDRWVALVGLIPLILGGIAWRYASLGQPQQFARAVGVCGVAFTVAVFGLMLPRVGEQQLITSLLQVPVESGQPARLASYAVHEPSWVFYAGREIPFLLAERQRDAIEFLNGDATALITSRTEYERIRDSLPVGTGPIAETDYFLKSERLVLIGRLSVAGGGGKLMR